MKKLSLFMAVAAVSTIPFSGAAQSQSVSQEDNASTKTLHSLLDPANDPALNRECN